MLVQSHVHALLSPLIDANTTKVGLKKHKTAIIIINIQYLLCARDYIRCFLYIYYI